MKFALAALVFVPAAVAAYLNRGLRARFLAAARRYASYARGLARTEKFSLKNTVLLQSAAAAITLFFCLSTGWWVLAAAAVPAILMLPSWHARAKRERYIRAYHEGLPAFIESVISCLRSGLSVPAALAEAASRDRTPVGAEVVQALKKAGLGMGMGEALSGIYTAVPLRENRIIFGAIAASMETGGNVTEVLSNVLDTIRRRAEAGREVRALTSQGVMSGVIIGALPVFLVGVISVIDPSFISPLFTTGWGLGLLAAAAAMEITGALIIRKIVDVK